MDFINQSYTAGLEKKVEALEQENATLKAERDEWHGKFMAKFLDFNKQGVELDAAKKGWLEQAARDAAEIVRLEKALAQAKQPIEQLLKQKELNDANHLEAGGWEECRCELCLAVNRVVQSQLHEAKQREAQRWDGLKVTNAQLAWALKELGPPGTNAEAYIKAAVEYLVSIRNKERPSKQPTPMIITSMVITLQDGPISYYEGVAKNKDGNEVCSATGPTLFGVVDTLCACISEIEKERQK